ncbi:tyrosine-type recombinase/integrase [Diplocloster agilis]|uniref:tyrosine-type recombinase/integrase n=1 Tax=Diplocloster agilis TaxID=2850323 RepID=UPI0008214C0C|nr:MULTISPECIES: tyrosine-type recombinase/integrase [Lachnospiraceae]MBU9746606.1 tyrosine-type recombinase/integrase [Diplocloster agilis]MCU6736459.1 tyrosine-type recombinase/integrase [Suonthocola fibrivorans]SCJ90760.1 Phage integrase family [uncultured Clostridium sp.]
MAKAKKLPSGSWRTQVYSHSELEYNKDGTIKIDSKTKKVKYKRIYVSFTAETKKESEYMAAEFALTKKGKSGCTNMTLRDAITQYIDSSDAVLSKKTIEEYRKMLKNGFQSIMDISLKNLTVQKLKQAVNEETKRPNKRYKKDPKPISSKTVRNEFGLISATLNAFDIDIDTKNIKLPERVPMIKELITPEIIFDIVHGTNTELPALLAMWLSFTLSEIRGIKKSESIRDGYILIKDVVIDVANEQYVKNRPKNATRFRPHRIPPYIQYLIDQTDQYGDHVVDMSITESALSRRFTRLIDRSGLPHMTFHDLRHVNASVMDMLNIPEKYRQERGGWKNNKVMKGVYTHTFSDERVRSDDIIDSYFESKMQHEMQHEKKEP